jgi:voltage-gated potassium channel
MILGYGIIAVPTGIVGVEMFRDQKTGQPIASTTLEETHCSNCGLTGHVEDANYCSNCAAKLE